MRIRPVDVKVPKCNPFENDLLDRESTARILTNMLQNLESPYTLSIDSSWGNGKTTFLNMWKQHLINEGFPVVGYNAWETDFTGNPLVALTSELLDNLKNDDNQHDTELKNLDKVTNNLLKYFSPARIAAGLSLMDFFSSIQPDDPLVSTAMGAAAVAATTAASLPESTKDEPPIATSDPSTYHDTKKAICSFQKILQDVASKLSKKHNNRPLIIAIDELDRCRPSYAVELLEIAKHFFAAKNIVFVLAIDKSQLAHAIKALYGNEFDSIGYLRRFIDLDFLLPNPNRTEFVGQLFEKTGILQFSQQNPGHYQGTFADARNLLHAFMGTPITSLRQVQQTMYRLGLVLASLDSPPTIAYAPAAVMTILKTIDPKAYNMFVRYNMTDKEVSDRVFDLPAMKTVRYTREGALFNALLIMAQYEFAKIHYSPSEFVESSLHNHIINNVSENTQDKQFHFHAGEVESHLKERRQMFDTVKRGNPVGFHLAAQRIELFSDDLLQNAS